MTICKNRCGQGQIILSVLSIFCFVSLFLSCTGEISPTEIQESFSKYPLKIGNSWKYNSETRYFNFRPDSIMGYFPGPVLQYSSTVSIPRTELLLDSIETYVIREEIFDKGSLERQAEKYYSNESDGFYIHAYAGLSIILPKKGFPILSFKNKSYQNMEHLLSTISYRFQYPVNSQIDSVYLEIPPLLVLPYPMQLGQSWNFRNSGDPYLIVKRVVDRETITTKSGRFTADVIQWLYDFDANGQWDDDITYLDYYSSVGLVKRSITFLNIALVDQGGNAIGYVDFSEISELKSYIVNP